MAAAGRQAHHLAAALLALLLGLALPRYGHAQVCKDDPAWSSTYGSCLTYAVGQGNHEYCAADFAIFPCPVACGSCVPARFNCSVAAPPGGGGVGDCPDNADLPDGTTCLAVCSDGSFFPQRCSNGTMHTPAACCQVGTAWDGGANSSCVRCTPGQSDHDSDPSTPCSFCSAGRFSNVTGDSGPCDGICSTGTVTAPEPGSWAPVGTGDCINVVGVDSISLSSALSACLLDGGCGSVFYHDDYNGCSSYIEGPYYLCSSSVSPGSSGDELGGCVVEWQEADSSELAASRISRGTGCVACVAGKTDHDSDASTPCVTCSSGRFTNITGDDGECKGTCHAGTFLGVYLEELVPTCNGCKLACDYSSVIEEYETESEASAACLSQAGCDIIIGCSSTASIGTASIGLAGSNADIMVHVHTLNWANEITWNIDGGSDYGPYQDNSDNYEELSLSIGTHQLHAMDSYGDGWHGGYWEVLDQCEPPGLVAGGADGVGLVQGNGGEFQVVITSAQANCSVASAIANPGGSIGGGGPGGASDADYSSDPDCHSSANPNDIVWKTCASYHSVSTVGLGHLKFYKKVHVGNGTVSIANCVPCEAGKTDADSNSSTPCEHCIPGRHSGGVAAVGQCSGSCLPGNSTVGSDGRHEGQGAVDCIPCEAGKADHDHDSTTPCALCDPGRFSEARGVAGDCQGTCPAGTVTNFFGRAVDPELPILMHNDEHTVRVRILQASGSTAVANEGILQLNIDDGGWGAVCDDGFGEKEADAVCRTLGFESGFQFDGYHGDDDFALDDLVCPIGDQTLLSDCESYRQPYSDNCVDAETVGITCTGQHYRQTASIAGDENYTAPGTACAECEAGQADHDSNSATACTRCAIGRFSSAVGLVGECSEDCLAGGFVSIERPTACIRCVPGRTDHDDNSTTPCAHCNAGRFSSDTGSRGQCLGECASGRFDRGSHSLVPTFAVLHGPCSIDGRHNGQCVHRLGYLAELAETLGIGEVENPYEYYYESPYEYYGEAETCIINVTESLVLTGCPSFNLYDGGYGVDQLLIDGVRYTGTDCPEERLVLSAGTLLTWHAPTTASGHTLYELRDSGIELETFGWEICSEPDAGASSGAECVLCEAGQTDHDADPATPCVECMRGRYSDLSIGATCIDDDSVMMSISGQNCSEAADAGACDELLVSSLGVNLTRSLCGCSCPIAAATCSENDRSLLAVYSSHVELVADRHINRPRMVVHAQADTCAQLLRQYYFPDICKTLVEHGICGCSCSVYTPMPVFECEGVCPAGSTSSSRGCARCEPGQADSDADASTPCVECARGRYSDTAGVIGNCTSCPRGSLSLRGSSSVADCFASSWRSQNGSSVDLPTETRLQLTVGNGIAIALDGGYFADGLFNGNGVAMDLRGAALNISRSYFLRNRCADTTANVEEETLSPHGRITSVLPLQSGGAVHVQNSSIWISFSTFVSNAAGLGGALYVTAQSSVDITSTEFVSNTASSINGEAKGGAVYVGGASSVRVTLSTFVDNLAFSREVPTSWYDFTMDTLGLHGSSAADYTIASVGGAVFVQGASLHIERSTFTSNVAVFGGSIYGAEATTAVDLRSCSFITDNSYPNAAEQDVYRTVAFGSVMEDVLFVDGARGSIVNTTFAPLKPSSVILSPLHPAGCQQHPCGVGEACMYENFSTFCLPCTGGTVGRDGRLCSPCPASTGPNDDRSDCVSCPSGQVSPYGVCVLCDGNAVPNAAADGCVRCSTNQIAVDGECVASVAETTAEADEPKEETLGCISDSRSSDGSSTATLAVSSLASLIAGIVIATAAVKTKPEYFVVKLGLLGDIGDRVDLISADKIAELRAKLEQLPQVLLEAAAADTASTTPNDGSSSEKSANPLWDNDAETE